MNIYTICVGKKTWEIFLQRLQRYKLESGVRNYTKLQDREIKTSWSLMYTENTNFALLWDSSKMKVYKYDLNFVFKTKFEWQKGSKLSLGFHLKFYLRLWSGFNWSLHFWFPFVIQWFSSYSDPPFIYLNALVLWTWILILKNRELLNIEHVLIVASNICWHQLTSWHRLVSI